ncbi:hypothetical protein EBT25_16490 [bacterium]|nr:hypothetical protein [bacterium]
MDPTTKAIFLNYIKVLNERINSLEKKLSGDAPVPATTSRGPATTATASFELESRLRDIEERVNKLIREKGTVPLELDARLRDLDVRQRDLEFKMTLTDVPIPASTLLSDLQPVSSQEPVEDDIIIKSQAAVPVEQTKKRVIRKKTTAKQ